LRISDNNSGRDKGQVGGMRVRGSKVGGVRVSGINMEG
jgi:hypothetical protein